MRACAFVATGVAILLTAEAGTPRAGAGTEPERIARLIQQLGDDAFAQREAASRELDAIGAPAVAALRKAAASSADAEIRRRAEAILRNVAARALAALASKELARWEGTWERAGETFHIKGDRWCWTMKGATPVYVNLIQIVAVHEKMTLADLLVGDARHPRVGQVVKAIFRLDGDTLHYCGTYDLPRPTAFIKGRPDPYYVEWKRIKK